MTEPHLARPDYDVIVVGGGPAGSSAAYFLSESGKRVLVLEKEIFPRYKTCGGGLSVRFLHQQFPFSFDPIIKTNVTAVSYVYRHQETTISLSPNAISVVMRDELDAYLLQQLKAEIIYGKEVQRVRELEDGVQVETKDGTCYTAAYLIGADGANSNVARSIWLRKRRILAAAIEAEVQVPPEMMRTFGDRLMFIFGEIHYGYLWIFPKQNHLTIGIGALHPKPGELQNTLNKVMARYGINLSETPLHGHPIPIYARHELVSTRKIMLVGDAAGLADPLSGEGIRFAIKSGRLAAESILRGHPEQYPKNLRRTIGLNHRLTMIISIAFYFFQDPFLLFGTPNPFSTQGIVEMLADRMTATEFILVGFITLPLFIVTEVIARLLNQLGFSSLSRRLRTRIYPADVSAS